MHESTSGHVLSRRRFFESLFGASLVLPSAALFRQVSQGRIDLHRHFGSPAWIALVNAKRTQGYQTWQSYTPAKAIDDMDNGGVETAFISITTPGIWFGNYDETRK